MIVNNEIRDWAWDSIEVQAGLCDKFRLSIFNVIWYKPWINDSELISYLNLYRKWHYKVVTKPDFIKNKKVA